MIEYTCLSYEKLSHFTKRIIAEPLEVAVNIVVAQNNRKRIYLVSRKGSACKLVYKGQFFLAWGAYIPYATVFHSVSPPFSSITAA